MSISAQLIPQTTNTETITLTAVVSKVDDCVAVAETQAPGVSS